MNFKIGDNVRIVKCERCPKVVGKTVKVISLAAINGMDYPQTVEVSYGRGRPQLGRPNTFLAEDITLVEGNG